jgi:hypothetical protein
MRELDRDALDGSLLSARHEGGQGVSAGGQRATLDPDALDGALVMSPGPTSNVSSRVGLDPDALDGALWVGPSRDRARPLAVEHVDGLVPDRGSSEDEREQEERPPVVAQVNPPPFVLPASTIRPAERASRRPPTSLLTPVASGASEPAARGRVAPVAGEEQAGAELETGAGAVMAGGALVAASAPVAARVGPPGSQREGRALPQDGARVPAYVAGEPEGEGAGSGASAAREVPDEVAVPTLPVGALTLIELPPPRRAATARGQEEEARVVAAAAVVGGVSEPAPDLAEVLEPVPWGARVRPVVWGLALTSALVASAAVGWAVSGWLGAEPEVGSALVQDAKAPGSSRQEPAVGAGEPVAVVIAPGSVGAPGAAPSAVGTGEPVAVGALAVVTAPGSMGAPGAAPSAVGTGEPVAVGASAVVTAPGSVGAPGAAPSAVGTGEPVAVEALAVVTAPGSVGAPGAAPSAGGAHAERQGVGGVAAPRAVGAAGLAGTPPAALPARDRVGDVGAHADRGTSANAPSRWLVPSALGASLPEAVALAAAVAEAAACPGVVNIVGHTCDLGDETFNVSLSLQRAEAVAAALRAAGLPPERIRVHGAGEGSPLVEARTLSARRANRRVEVECFNPR